MEVEEVYDEDTPFVSKIISAPATRRLPSDLLDERQAFSRHISRSIGIPSIDDLMKHAERFGTDQVVETAVELGYSLESCARIMDHCDRVDLASFRKLHPHAPSPKIKPAEDRCKTLLGITDKEEDAEKE